MKKISAVVMVVVMFLLCANMGFAQQITNNNSNIPTATGGAATQNQDMQQGQEQEQIMQTPTQLMNLQYGTNFVNPGLGIRNKGWEIYTAATYTFLSYNKVQRMKKGWTLFSKSCVTTQMIGEPIHGKPYGISIMNYWPKDVVNPGDDVIVAVNVKGEADWPEESFLGLGAAECLAKGSDRMAVLYTTDYNGVTAGRSISLGGSTSSVFSGGTKGAVVTAGGQLGTNETSVEEHNSFKILCMNPGLLNYYPPADDTVKSQAAPTEAPAAVPAPEQKIEPRPSCNPEVIRKEINDLTSLIKDCREWGLHNMTLRYKRANKYNELAECTGENGYYSNTAEDFRIAEDNYYNGADIKAHRVEADQLLYKVRYNWAWSIRNVQGPDAEASFARSRKLDKTGDRTMPTTINDLKK